MRTLKGYKVPRKVRRALGTTWIVLSQAIKEAAAFARRHKQLTEAIIVAGICAGLLRLVPFFGKFLALGALATGVVLGLVADLRALVRS